MKNRFKVGSYNIAYNSILGIELKGGSIYQSKGLKAHMLKRKHYKAAKYIDAIPDILSFPDYIGLSKCNDDYSIEYVKCFADNMRVVVKIDPKDDTLYVATMFELPKKKLDRFLYSGRLKKVFD